MQKCLPHTVILSDTKYLEMAESVTHWIWTVIIRNSRSSYYLLQLRYGLFFLALSPCFLVFIFSKHKKTKCCSKRVNVCFQFVLELPIKVLICTIDLQEFIASKKTYVQLNDMSLFVMYVYCVNRDRKTNVLLVFFGFLNVAAFHM